MKIIRTSIVSLKYFCTVLAYNLLIAFTIYTITTHIIIFVKTIPQPPKFVLSPLFCIRSNFLPFFNFFLL